MIETLLTLEELISGTKGKIIGECRNCCFTSVQTDSRNVCEKTLFVPLVGEFQDGHKYIPQAIEKGASVVLLNDEDYEMNKKDWAENFKKYPDVLFVSVENTLHGLQGAAEAYVAKFPDLTKISITGSCGKTTTKEMMVSVMKAKYGNEVVYTKGNFNSETGLPLSVFQIRAEHKIGIFEMGMNRVNEIGEISKVLKSKYGIITNIGTAHIGILGSRKNIADEKRKSFAYIPEDGVVFVPAEDDFADYCGEICKGRVVKFGKNVSESVSGVKYIASHGFDGTDFSVDGIQIRLPVNGEYNYQNALGVIACAKELGLTALEIKAGLENMVAVSGRMETQEKVLKSGKKVILIKDCYNANLDSMTGVINFCGELKDCKSKYFVLGDMKELGTESVASHRKIGELICSVKPAKAYIVGPEMIAAYEVCKHSDFAVYYSEKNESNYKEIAEKLLAECDDDSVILLKGSHSMSLETLVPLIIDDSEKKEAM